MGQARSFSSHRGGSGLCPVIEVRGGWMPCLKSSVGATCCLVSQKRWKALAEAPVMDARNKGGKSTKRGNRERARARGARREANAEVRRHGAARGLALIRRWRGRARPLEAAGFAVGFTVGTQSASQSASQSARSRLAVGIAACPGSTPLGSSGSFPLGGSEPCPGSHPIRSQLYPGAFRLGGS